MDDVSTLQDIKLEKQWHPSRNNHSVLNDYSYKSGHTAWWLCEKSSEHEWQAKISNRRNGSGCPYCTGKKACSDNNLTVTAPEIARQWHPDLSKNEGLRPQDVTNKSGRNIWWQCIDNPIHVWQAKVCSRTNGDGLCPGCTSRKVFSDNNLETLFPDLSKQWHPTKNNGKEPSEYLPGSQLKVFWICDEEHVWQAQISARRKGSGCPTCYKNNKKQTDISIIDYRDEWHPIKNGNLNINDLSHGSGKKTWWQCLKNPEHIWETEFRNRVRGHRCPQCAGIRADSTNNLLQKDPELASEWHPTRNGDLIPADCTPSSPQEVWWQCLKNSEHIWNASISNRRKKQGCPYCSGRLPSKENNFAVAYPHLVDEWHPTKNKEAQPTDYLPKSEEKVWWRCTNDSAHPDWLAPIRVRSWKGCIYCSDRIMTEFNNLEFSHPKIAQQWDYEKNKNIDLTPKTIHPGSQAKVYWLCPQGHSTLSSVMNKVKGTVCSICSNKRADENNNITQDPKHANLLLEVHPTKNPGLDLSTKKAGSHTIIWWQCPQGHEWEAAIKTRALSGSGCSACADYGFDLSKPAILYFLVDETREVGKVGISNSIDKRVKKHQRNGFGKTIKIWSFEEGSDARAVEKSTLNHIRSLDIPKVIDGGDGWTEMFELEILGSAISIDPPTYIVELVEQMILACVHNKSA